MLMKQSPKIKNIAKPTNLREIIRKYALVSLSNKLRTWDDRLRSDILLADKKGE